MIPGLTTTLGGGSGGFSGSSSASTGSVGPFQGGSIGPVTFGGGGISNQTLMIVGGAALVALFLFTKK